MNRLTTVFLDAGGVLLDESEQEVALATAAAARLSEIVPGYSEAQYWADIDEAVRGYCPRTYSYVFWKYLQPDVAGCASIYGEFMKTWKATSPALRIMPEVDVELHRLAEDFQIGIAGQYGEELLSVLEEHRLIDCFTWRFTQADFTLSKPDPRYYQQILDACGVDAGACVMVGDRIDKDVIPVRQLGMRTIRIRVGLHEAQRPRIPEEVPDRELYSVAGLAAAVADLGGPMKGESRP